MGNYTPEELVAGDAMRQAHAFCPTDMPHLERMRWMGKFVHDKIAATLRQQAGRADEGMVADALRVFHAAYAAARAGSPRRAGATYAAVQAVLQFAALAQNTQGEGEPVAWLHTVTQGEGETDQALSFSRDSFPLDTQLGFRSLGAVPLYLHAERARVPVGIEAAIAHIQAKAEAYADEHCGVEWDTGATTYHHGQAGEEYHHGLLELVDELQVLAAAPSQRAEVKCTHDIDERGHRIWGSESASD